MRMLNRWEIEEVIRDATVGVLLKLAHFPCEGAACSYLGKCVRGALLRRLRRARLNEAAEVATSSKAIVCEQSAQVDAVDLCEAIRSRLQGQERTLLRELCRGVEERRALAAKLQVSRRTISRLLRRIQKATIQLLDEARRAEAGEDCSCCHTHTHTRQ